MLSDGCVSANNKNRTYNQFRITFEIVSVIFINPLGVIYNILIKYIAYNDTCKYVCSYIHVFFSMFDC